MIIKTKLAKVLDKVNISNLNISQCLIKDFIQRPTSLHWKMKLKIMRVCQKNINNSNNLTLEILVKWIITSIPSIIIKIEVY
jgi:hypothetical protein